ncbi:MAG: hypothetical protein ACK5LY_08060 [Lachnospirales bacterium]
MDLENVEDFFSEMDIDSNISLEKIRKMSNVLNKVKEKSKLYSFSSNEEHSKMEGKYENFNRHYEDKIQEKGIKNIYSILPYLDLRYQKSFLIYSKILEVQILQSMFEDSQVSQNRGKRNSKDILSLVIDSLPKAKKERIDNLFQMASFFEIFKETMSSNEDIISKNIENFDLKENENEVKDSFIMEDEYEKFEL